MTPKDIIDNWCSEWRVVDRDRLLADIKQAITEAVEKERLRQTAPMDCGHPLACFSPWGGGADNLPKPPGSLPDCLECRGILEERRACAETVRGQNHSGFLMGHMVQQVYGRHGFGDVWDKLSNEKREELRANWQQMFQSDLNCIAQAIEARGKKNEK